MALEPVSDAPVTNTPVEANLAATLETALLGGHVEPTEPATPEPAAPEPTPPVTPTPPADPIKALTETEEPDPNKLPIDEDEPPVEPEPEPTGDKAGKRIQALKEEIKSVYKPKLTELETTLKTKESRITELEATAAKTAELEEKIAQYEKEISVVRLEQRPEFIDAVTKPLKEMSDKVTAIAENYGIEAPKLIAAIAEPDETKRRGLFKSLLSGADVDVEDQIELRNIATRTHEVYAKEDQLYKNADGALAELLAKKESETVAQAAVRAEERAKATDTAAASIVKALPFLSDLLPDLAKKVKDTPLETLDPLRASYNALAGEALPKLKVELSRKQAELDQALDELASYRKSSPRVSATGGQTPTAGSHTDLTKALLEGAGLA